MSLACHTLADLRTFVHTASARSHLPTALVALPEAGRRQLVRVWPAHFQRPPDRRPGGRCFARPTFLAALGIPNPWCALSIHRVLAALRHKGLPNTLIGALIHTSIPGGLNFPALDDLPWSSGLRRGQCPGGLQPLLDLKLITPRPFTTENGRTQVNYPLTPAGENLLLGHWGRAARHNPTRPPTLPRSSAPAPYINATAA